MSEFKEGDRVRLVKGFKPKDAFGGTEYSGIPLGTIGIVTSIGTEGVHVKFPNKDHSLYLFSKRLEKVRFVEGDRVVMVDSDWNDIPNGTLGTVESVKDKSSVISVKWDTRDYAAHYYTDRVKLAEQHISNPENGFKKGDRVKLVKTDKGEDHRSGIKKYSLGTVTEDSSPGKSCIAEVTWDNGKHKSMFNYRLEIANERKEETVNPEYEKLHHCMKVSSEGTGFDKLGDFDLVSSEVKNYLWTNFGAGTYLVKVKNENKGEIFTLKVADNPFEVVEGF